MATNPYTTGGPGAGTQVSSGASNQHVSEREDLANFISMITRDETPFMSSIGKTKAKAIYHEWQTDELEAPGNSQLAEGTDWTKPIAAPANDSLFNKIGPDRTRLGNYSQINGKAMAVSGTKRAVDQAGVADEYAYQLKKRGTELRRDIESDLVHSLQVAKGGQTTRQFGAVMSWINDPRTSLVLTDDDGNQAFLQHRDDATQRGIGTHTFELSEAPANSTDDADGQTARNLEISSDRAAFSLDYIDNVMQMIYEEGGKAHKVMVSPALRRSFSSQAQVQSNVRRNVDEKGKLRQSVDFYMSDFGEIMIVPNYIMGISKTQDVFTATGTTNAVKVEVDMKDFMALIYDPMWFSIATLRPLKEVDVGEQGDSTVGMMVEECTLEVKNPIGCGAVYGLTA